MAKVVTDDHKDAVEAGIVGAVVGAAVGAAAVALSNPKTRKKLGDELNKFEKKGQKAYSEFKDKVADLSSQGEKKVEEAKKAIKSKL